VILLQLAKAADKVSDAQQLSSDLDDVKAITDVEKQEDDPGADAIRGALNIRRFSTIRKSGRASKVDATGAAPAIRLQSRKWKRDVLKDGHFINVPSEWAAMQRESTIREVPAEEEGRSSVQFDPTAPVTHIYPPRRQSPEDNGSEEMVEYPTRRGSHHMPLSPVETPDFISAPPTPRYTIPKRPHIEKQFSFGRGKGRKKLTEEETIGLVEAGRNEAGGSNDEGDSLSQHSEDSDIGETIHYEHPSGELATNPYGRV
jgi:hypothetical protein